MSECQLIVNEATAWCNLELQKYPRLQMIEADSWDVSDELFDEAGTAREAMDAACIAGDEAATKVAARRWCKAWRKILKAATAAYKGDK